MTVSFDDWLAGAHPSEVAVDILQDGTLLSRYESWQARYEAASAEPVGERSAGEVDPVAALREEGQALFEAIQASRSTWFVRGLLDEEEVAVQAAFPLPDDPRKPFAEPAPLLPVNATEKQSEAYIVALQAWGLKRQEHQNRESVSPEYAAFQQATLPVLRARALERLRRAFVRVEKDGETIISEKPSVELLARLEAAIGEHQYSKLFDAIEAASSESPVIPSDFLLKASTSDHD